MNKRSLALKLLPVLIIVMALSAFLYMKSTRPERKKAVPNEKVWLVNVMPAELQNRAPSITLYGHVETQELFRASAPGGGVVETVGVRPGQQVNKGQRLVTLDKRDFSAARLQAQADVNDIKAQIEELGLRHQSNLKALDQEKLLLQLAEKEVQRNTRLKKNNLSSESAVSNASEALGRQTLSLISKQLEVDRYATTLTQLKSRQNRAKARLAETQLALERSDILSSFDGVVAEVSVAAGDLVRINDQLISVYSLEALEIRARIPARYQSEIAHVLEQGQTLSARALVTGGEITLSLLRLAGEAGPSGIDAYFKPEMGAKSLRIGNLLKLELSLPEQENVIAVPFRAIYGNNRLYLFNDGVMKSVNVETLGQAESKRGEKLLLVRNSEINGDTSIITTHLPNAIDGLKVKIVEN